MTIIPEGWENSEFIILLAWSYHKYDVWVTQIWIYEGGSTRNLILDIWIQQAKLTCDEEGIV